MSSEYRRHSGALHKLMIIHPYGVGLVTIVHEPVIIWFLKIFGGFQSRSGW
ncbi:Hypothetical protein GbCGDNIH3_5004 [Granulibacter bethesdensis]|uniref:Uncharacterized protein n=1 Tax=Granulibacter bethesdensis TaxID=364410 RepID=A0AAN0VEQ0_9PROT|nr:Hypothetical protein GbCGDNIH3_5004 [Granulibacter bethesdensis]AHJ64489.1 Hypothetical protein GbCGDNIH4_5004 [Granulibacter bethesdensis CGDNIH4]APH58410.1 Hypothetical protein GbCGDNIH7_5004 [Granulibacter bethesdensis]